MRIWALAFLIGILILQQFSHLPSIYWVMTSLVSFILFVRFLREKLFSYHLLIIISGLTCGFSWSLAHAHWLMEQRLSDQYEGIDLIIEGQISSLPVNKTIRGQGKYQTRSIRFEFTPTNVRRSIPKNAHLITSIDLNHFPKKLRLSWYRPTAVIYAGEYWRFKVRLKRPYGMMNPGGYDYEKALYQKRIQAKGSIKKSDLNQKLNIVPFDSRLSTLLLSVRQGLLTKLNMLDIGEQSDFIRSVTQSLILGYRGGLDASQWRVFQRTGTIHLMAISGLHIGLVAALVYGLISFCWRMIGVGCLTVPAPQIAAIAALLAAASYAALAGFTIPTQRALVMLLVGMIHIIFKRTPLPVSKTIAIALILVLLFDPLATLSQGFWLSFVAVSVIIYLMQATNSKKINTIKSDNNTASLLAVDSADNFQSGVLITIKKILNAFVNSCLTFGRLQWALTIALFPLVLYFYQSSSLVSPIANLIAIPVISLAVVPLMFLATLLLFVNTVIANSVFSITNFIYSLLWEFLEILSKWDYATFELSIDSLWVLVLSYMGIALWLSVKGTPMRWLAIVFVLPMLIHSKDVLDDGEAIVTVLDVGQGLSSIVQTKNHTVVFDAGAKYSENFDIGRAVVIPFFQHIGRNKIDTVIISHGDNDHLGGFTSIATNIPIQNVLTSIPDSAVIQKESKSDSGKINYKVSSCQRGQKWMFDNVEFSILSPVEINSVAENGHDKNNQSCVLKISTNFGSALITGDIEREMESHLYHSYPESLQSEVLVVPHHGSNTSSLKGFIKTVDPDYAVFTVGYKNRYNLPNTKVVKRYQQTSKATLYKTNETGALSFHFKLNSSLNPTAYRLQTLKYWHTRNKPTY